MPIDHVLVAGGIEDLESMRALLALLAPGTYGQVYVEADADIDLSSLAAPARITVTRLSRPEHSRRTFDAVLTTNGTLLAEAIASWASEWIPEEPTTDRIVTMWVGSSTSECVNALCELLPQQPERF